jgi:hypothetical protein
VTWRALPLALALAACGYTAGLDLSKEGVRSVAVEVAANDSFRQRLEIPLTTQIYEQLPVHTGLHPASMSTADAVLRVEITDVSERSLVQGSVHPVEEGALLFQVRAILRDRRTGAVLRDRLVTDRAEFRTPIGETESSATQEAASDLARKIALALEADF